MITRTERDIFEDALRNIRTITDRNAVKFGFDFPGPNTEKGIYPFSPSVSLLGSEGEILEHKEGSNTGWTTGFWSGILWLLHEFYASEKPYKNILEAHLKSFKDRAERKIDSGHHDVGFLYSLSCLPAVRLYNDQEACRTAINAADILCSRFIEKAGIIQAWGELNDPEESGKIIIDSLMNLPLLYWAGEKTGDPRYRNCAYRHALNAAANLVRADGTTYHTFYFDPETGRPLRGNTKQGYSADSCWARGQAWAVYGFVLSYHFTRDPDFLNAARKTASRFLSSLPEDKVAYWDLIFNDGDLQERDSSAAAIAACGLLELAGLTGISKNEEGRKYYESAKDIVLSLCRDYTPRNDTVNEGLILHGVYYKGGDIGVDESNLWGDYFYLEALLRLIGPGSGGRYFFAL